MNWNGACFGSLPKMEYSNRRRLDSWAHQEIIHSKHIVKIRKWKGKDEEEKKVPSTSLCDFQLGHMSHRLVILMHDLCFNSFVLFFIFSKFVDSICNPYIHYESHDNLPNSLFKEYRCKIFLFVTLCNLFEQYLLCTAFFSC